MPAVNILIWNIEKFGAWNKPAKGDAANGRVAQLQIPFIAYLVDQMQADILVIEEFRQNGVGHLATLQGVLNGLTGAVWHYDYIPGAVVANLPPGGIGGIGFGQLGYTPAANSEGYAVLFRNGMLSALPAPHMSRGANNNPGNPHFMKLVVETRPWNVVPGNPPRIDAVPAPGFGQANFPRSNTAGFGQPRVTRARVIQPEDWIANWLDVRRPCYMEIPDQGDGHGPAGLIVYHLPVNEDSNYYGTQIAGWAREIRGAGGGARFVVGGDFNLVSDRHLTYGFSNFTNNNMTPATLGASGDDEGVKDVNAAGYQRSSVHYTGWSVPLGAARDQVLIGNDGNLDATGFVVDVLGMLCDHTNGLAEDVFGDAGIGGAVNAVPTPPGGAHNGAGPWAMDTDAYGVASIAQLYAPWNAMHNPAFPDQTVAAVFYKQFISDHLPLFAQITV